MAHLRKPFLPVLGLWALCGCHGGMLRPSPGKPVGRQVSASEQAVRLIVKVKVLAADRGAPPEEDWIRRELKAMQIPAGVGSGERWITLGQEPVTILDAKHFGQVSLALANPEGTSPFLIEISGTQPAQHELPRTAGARRLIQHTSSSSIAAIDFYFAFQVEAAAPQ